MTNWQIPEVTPEAGDKSQLPLLCHEGAPVTLTQLGRDGMTTRSSKGGSQAANIKKPRTDPFKELTRSRSLRRSE